MESRNGRIEAWCDRSLFVSPLYFALCLTPKAFKRELKHLKVPREQWPAFVANNQSHATTHFFVRKQKQCAIICIEGTDKHTAEQVMGLLIHEAVHLWQAIREDVGEKTPSHEFEAYALQSLCQELMQKFSDLGGKYASRVQR